MSEREQTIGQGTESQEKTPTEGSVIPQDFHTRGPLVGLIDLSNQVGDLSKAIGRKLKDDKATEPQKEDQGSAFRAVRIGSSNRIEFVPLTQAPRPN